MKRTKKEEVGTTEAKKVGCSWAVSVSMSQSMSAAEVKMKVEGGAGKAGTGAQTELVKASTEQRAARKVRVQVRGRREKRRCEKEDGYRSRI
jgi:hypothetical protein